MFIESRMMLHNILSSLQGVPGAQGRSGSPGDRVSVNAVIRFLSDLLP